MKRLLLTLCLLLLSACAPSTPPPADAAAASVIWRIVGFVYADLNNNGSYDANEGLADAEVLLSTGAAYLTAANGWFGFANLPDGQYVLVANCPSGWSCGSAAVQIKAGAKVVQNLLARPAPPTVTPTATSAPTATPTATPTASATATATPAPRWLIAPGCGDCFTLTRLSDGVVYCLCVQDVPLLHVFPQPTATLMPN